MDQNDNLTSLSSSSYSFYLNLVVLNNVPVMTMSKHGNMNDEGEIVEPPSIPERIEEESQDDDENEDDGFPSKMATMKFLKGLSKSSKAVKNASSTVGNVAAAFVAKNTMVEDQKHKGESEVQPM